jgi:hypothetical protein
VKEKVAARGAGKEWNTGGDLRGKTKVKAEKVGSRKP